MPEALPNQPNLIGIIDALIDLFGASQDTTVESAALNRNSVFNDVIKNNTGIDNRTIDSLNGGESGLYALILSNKTLLESIINTNVIPGSAYMNYLVDVWNRNNSQETSDDDQYRELAHVLNLNEYYIFILSRTHQSDPFPTVSNVFGQNNNYSFSGLNNYPVARTTTKRMREEEIPPGSLVKIQYDNALTKDILSVVDIVENTPEFTQMVLGAFAQESALVQVTNCARDSVFRAEHASGDQIGVESEPAPVPEPEPESDFSFETLAYTQEQLNDIKAADLVLFTSPVVCGGCVILEEEYFDIVGITTAQIQMFDPINPKGSGTSGETELPDDNGLYDTIANNPTQGTGTITLPTLAQYQGGVLTFISEDSASIRSFIKNIAGDK